MKINSWVSSESQLGDKTSAVSPVIQSQQSTETKSTEHDEMPYTTLAMQNIQKYIQELRCQVAKNVGESIKLEHLRYIKYKI